MTTPDQVPCHSCTDSPGQDEHGNPCPRCRGTGERDAREAAAHLAMLNARKAEDEARVAYRLAPESKRYALSKLVDAAVANVRKARDVWDDVLARNAAEDDAARLREDAAKVAAKKVAA